MTRKFYAPPLQEALSNGNLKVAKQLLMAGANPNGTDTVLGSPALFWAETVEAISLLLAYGADARQRSTTDLSTVLHAVAKRPGKAAAAMAELLIEAGAGVHVNAMDAAHMTPMIVCQYAGNRAVAKVLVKYGAAYVGDSAELEGSDDEYTTDEDTDMYEASTPNRSASSNSS